MRLTLVNPASRGRTVGYIRFDKLDNAILSQPPYEGEDNGEVLKYWIPNTSYVQVRMSGDKILELPLDIPPHQSRSRWYALLFQMNEKVQDFDIPKVRVQVFAEDIFRKRLAKYDDTLELKSYTIY